MRIKLAGLGLSAVLLLVANSAHSAIITFDAGTPSDLANGGSLVTTPGTVAIGEVARYVSGGTGLVGQANVWPVAVSPSVAASEIGGHYWLQGDPKILFQFTSAQSQVISVAGIDHGPLPGEALEFIIWGSNAAGALLEEGAITSVFDDGVDPTAGVVGESDDFSAIWSFTGSYSYFVSTAGDHIAGFSSPGEYEIDGLAAVPEDQGPGDIPEPTALVIWSLLATLGLTLGWRRRWRS